MPLYLPKYECSLISGKPESMDEHPCLVWVTKCKQTNVTVKLINNVLQCCCKTLLRACLHGGGGPQVGEVARLGGVTRLSI